MTIRPPQSLSPRGVTGSGLNVLEYELMAERADALGRHGLKVETAIAALSGLTPTSSRRRKGIGCSTRQPMRSGHF